MKVSQIIFLIFSVGVLSGQGVPDWVENIPLDSKYYWARESVGIQNLSENEYKERANAQAFAAISSSIRTTVSSQTTSSLFSNTTQDGEYFADIFDQESNTSSMSDIQGAEMVGDYTTSTTYWVLWRLNKATHEKNMEKFVDAAKNQYEGFLETSDNDPVQQLQFLVPAYEAVVKVVGVPALVNGKNLRTEIPNQIAAILNSIRLVPDGKTDFTAQAGFSLPKPLKVRVNASKKMNVSDIPIIYTCETGEVEFSSPNIFTSSSGRANTKVSRVVSNKSTQRIRASIDLKEWREDRLSRLVSFERRLDEISRSNSVIFNLDVARVTQEEVAVITVGDTSVYSEREFKRLNRSFRKQFNVITEYKLKDEALAEEAMNQYKRSSELCSSEECQIKIGKKLGIQRLIFIDIQEYPKEIAVTIFLRNIIENELEMEYTYSFEKSNRDSKEDRIKIIENNAREMVEDFWIRNNPSYLTVRINRRNIKADFIHQNPTRWMETEFEERLPLNNKRFFEGDYLAQIDIPGYEFFETNFECPMGEVVELEVDLIQKTPGKAFWKSFVIPGRGQIYSHDKNNTSRKMMGYIFMGAWAGATAAMGASWNSFFAAQDEYNEANDNYLTQKLLDDVQIYRTIAEEKNDAMVKKQTTAIIASGIWGAVWLGSAFEAMWNFPSSRKRYGNTDNGFRLSMNTAGGNLSPQLNYVYQWK